MPSQAPGSIFMVRPATPQFNKLTSASNVFQSLSDYTDPLELKKIVQAEFDKMIELLQSNDVDVKVFDDDPGVIKPDAHFPNNWVSTHPDGHVVLYPMLAENRRVERRQDIVRWLDRNYRIRKIIDLSVLEKSNRFLEGTGSLVFDYPNRIVYACLSERTDEKLVHEVATTLSFRSIIFHAVDERGLPIYHTNVVMSVGSKHATLCLDAVRSDVEQELLLQALTETGHKVVAISYDQMRAFAGNMFELSDRSGASIVVLSETAFNSLLPGQVDAISRFADMLPVSIPTIEGIGGGSVRCMIAGIYLPKR